MLKEVHGVVLGLTPEPVKSSYSSLPTNNCVMVGSSRPDAVQVSDSKLADSPELNVSSEAWNAMITDVIGHR